MRTQSIHDFEQTTRILSDPDEPLTAAVIYSLSNISEDDFAQLALGWTSYPVERRRQLIRRLGELSEVNFEVNFDAVNLLALEDPDWEVRVAAIEGLWENESVSLMRHLIALSTSDPITEVRAAAVSALGRFILLGELGKFPEAEATLAQDAALDLLNQADEHIDVRRRALEAIANCGREGLSELIEEAYMEPSLKMRASALFAMGRSCDTRWRSIILDELEGDEPELLYEAARAAGELELSAAVGRLARLLTHEDREVQEMAVWALGEIGNPRARRLLEDAAETAPDEAFAEAVEEALENAYLVSDGLRFEMFDFAEAHHNGSRYDAYDEPDEDDDGDIDDEDIDDEDDDAFDDDYEDDDLDDLEGDEREDWRW